MTSSAVTAILVVLLGAPLLKLLDVVFTRKRNSADLESVRVKNEIERNAGLYQQVGALDKAVDDLSRDLEVMRRRDRIQRRLLHRHDLWDLQAVNALRGAGIDLPDPPSLDIDEEPDPRGVRTRATDYTTTTTTGREDGDERRT